MFTGEVKNGYMYVGRLAGYFSGSKYEWSLRNCANYGEVAQVGTAGRMYFGGIVAYGFGYTQKNCTIKNCLNTGALTTGDGMY